MSPVLLQLLLGSIQLLTELLRALVQWGLGLFRHQLRLTSPSSIPFPYCLL